jgi:glyoxylase-like metal-dependent hydrolase (beta-lactamase superfamily II)
MRGGQAQRLPDAAGYEVWLLCVGSLEFKPGEFLPDRGGTIPVNALLLRGHGETLLVDAGSGPADVIWPGAAMLDAALASAGVAASEIDAVVLTHLDFDHSGGTLAGTWPDDLEPAFPRAILSEVGFGQRRPNERDDWDVGTRLIAAYDSAGRLERAPDGAEFRPALRLVGAPGHTPGHCILRIGDELVHGADLIHLAEHVEHPEWDGSDGSPGQGLETRRRWLTRLADEGVPVVFSHLDGPGRLLPGPTWRPGI